MGPIARWAVSLGATSGLAIAVLLFGQGQCSLSRDNQTREVCRPLVEAHAAKDVVERNATHSTLSTRIDAIEATQREQAAALAEIKSSLGILARDLSWFRTYLDVPKHEKRQRRDH